MERAVQAELVRTGLQARDHKTMLKRINSRLNTLWQTAQKFSTERNLTKDSAVGTYSQDASSSIRTAFGLKVKDKVTKEQTRSWVVRVACAVKLGNMPIGAKCIRFPPTYQVPESLRLMLPDIGNFSQFHILISHHHFLFCTVENIMIIVPGGEEPTATSPAVGSNYTEDL